MELIMMKADLIIRNGYIVTMNETMDVIENGSIVIQGNLIIEIDKTEVIDSKCVSDNVIDATGKIVMPGMINCHTHVPMAFFRGYADDLPLMSWLQDHIWPVEGKFVAPEFVYDSALHGLAEMIQNGITMFNDQYFHGKETAQAAIKAGIRGLIGEGILDFPVANYTSPNEIIDYTIRMQEHFESHETIEFCMSPHSIYTCSEATLKHALDQANKHNMMIHIHMSETQKEVDDSVKNFGLRPVHYIDKIGLLNRPIIFAHGVWVDEKEQELMARKNVSVALNTESNLKLASGFAPVKGYMEKGVNLCLGTDGVASNNNLSLLEELDTTAKLHKALHLDPTLLPAEEALKMVTINAAKALQKGHQLGSLETGKFADIITLKNDTLEAMPMYNVYSHIVYTLNSAAVQDSVINGKIVLENRKLPHLEMDSILEKSNYHINNIKASRS